MAAMRAIALFALFLAGCCGSKDKATPATYDPSTTPPGPKATATSSAPGAGGWHAPATACGLLRAEGLGGGDYKKMGDEWTCLSPGVDISATKAPSGLANTLRYFAEGTEARVGLLKLYVNVNVAAEAPAAQKRLGELAAALTRKALGGELPAAAVAAVSAGRAGTWTVAGAKVALERDTWPTGKGFSLKFTVE